MAVAHDWFGWIVCLSIGRTGVYDWRLHLYKRRTESNTGQVWISRDLARSCDMWGCVSLCSYVFLCAAVGRVIECWFTFGESDGAMKLICYKSSAALLIKTKYYYSKDCSWLMPSISVATIFIISKVPMDTECRPPSINSYQIDD